MRFWAGHSNYIFDRFVSICIVIVIRETDPRSSVEAARLFSNMADFSSLGHCHLGDVT